MTTPRPGPVPPLLGALIAPLYAIGITSRNRRFDRGVGVARLPIPIISVGNLSVGGTGKTPMVALLVRELLAAGHRPCIAMRGYQPKRAPRTRPGSAAAAVGGATEGISDEAELYKHLFPGLPIVAQPDRTAGLRKLLESPKDDGTGSGLIDCVVLDDGFQHRQLARDLDIVLIDASRSPFEDSLLPRGWLREPTTSLARAHAVVITHAELATPDALSALTAQLTRAHGKPPIATTRHAWDSLTVFSPTDNTDTPADPSSLRGKRILALSAIGNPDAFLAAAAAAVAPTGHLTPLTLPDHEPYLPHTITRITRAATSAGVDTILTTDKDWAKLSRLPPSTWPLPITRPHLTLTFDHGREALLTLARAAVTHSCGTNR